jgi:hypothetical protein
MKGTKDGRNEKWKALGGSCMQSISKTLSVAVIFFSSFIVLAADRKSPNVLIIMADDCTYNDL